MSDNPAGFGNTGDLFISHSHADTDLVHPFVKALNDAGVSTWCSSIDNKISTRAITSVVQEKLRTSKLVIGLLSNNALEEYDRQTGLKKYHISAELNYAIRRDKLWSIIISKLDELPYHIENFPFYDFTEDIPPFSGEKWDGFLNAVKDEIDRRTQAPASSVRDPLAQAGGDAQEGGGDPAAPPEPPAFSAPFRASETIGSLLEVNDPAYGRDDAAPRIAPPSKQASLSEKALAKLANPAEITVTARDWCMFNLQALVEKGLAGQDPLAVHKTARAGNSDAQALVGLAHILGIAPFDQDYAAAGRWLERAGASGHARAKAELAVMIASRKFATYDLERIDQLAAEAAATDCARAKTYRALLRQTGTRLPSLTFEDSVRLLEEAHKQGDWLASTHFGWRLLRGNGIRRDVRRGISMLQDAAQAGEARACSYLGMAHGEGRGVPASAEKAAHWFRRAAQGGDLLGLFQWAWCHEAGYGTARDAGEARRLYRQASDRNDERATIRLAMMLLDGRGGVANPAEAAALLERSCMANNDDAKSLLAELHLEGRGVERDVAKAVELLEDAADSDQPWALWALGKLCEDGTGVPRDRERAVSLYRRAAFSATNLDLFRAILRRLDAMGERLRSPVG